MSIGEIPQQFQDEVISLLPAGSKVVVPELPMGMFSLSSPEELCEHVDRLIVDIVKELNPEKIILVGFSTGTLLVRGAVLEDFNRTRRKWLGRLDRIILVAGILRGWTVSSATPARFRVGEVFIRGAARLVSISNYLFSGLCWKRTLGELTERGEPFVISQRLRFHTAVGCLSDIPIVCLLGTEDEFVSPNDVIEEGMLDNIYYIEIRGADHLTIVNPDTRVICSQLKKDRVVKLKAAFQGSQTDLREHQLSVDYLDSYLDPMDLPKSRTGYLETKDVVIVLHGIRDNGFWTNRIGAQLKKDQHTLAIRTPTPSYGYFSAVDFIFPLSRYKKTCWLLEVYADLKSMFPNASISVLGHSNGSYLAAHAMEVCPDIRFKNIYFAGSVVRRDYDWNERVNRGQIEGRVVNVFSSDDRVIALAPAFVEALGLSGLNVGGAGYKGFKEVTLPDQVENFGPYSGKHSAGIAPEFWKSIASFMVNGEFTPPKEPDGKNHNFQHGLLRVVLLILLLVMIALSLYVWGYVMKALLQGYLLSWQFLSLAGTLVFWWLMFRVARIF